MVQASRLLDKIKKSLSTLFVFGLPETFFEGRIDIAFVNSSPFSVDVLANLVLNKKLRLVRQAVAVLSFAMTSIASSRCTFL